MPKLPGINHLEAVKALEKAGFRIVRQGKHIVISDGVRIIIENDDAQIVAESHREAKELAEALGLPRRQA